MVHHVALIILQRGSRWGSAVQQEAQLQHRATTSTGAPRRRQTGGKWRRRQRRMAAAAEQHPLRQQAPQPWRVN